MQDRIESNVTEPAIPVRAEHDIPAYLSSDEALVHILDRYPAHLVDIRRYDFRDNGGIAWTRGRRGNADGQTILEAVKSGQFRITLDGIERAHPGLWAEVRQALASLNPHLEANALSLSCSLVISSATARFPCRFETDNIVLFQLRGFQRVWVYPTDDAHLPGAEVERAVTGRSSGRLPANRIEDNAAWRFGVVPGEVLTWPLHAPHYSENEQGLCVSVVIAYETETSRFANRLHLANNVLRRWGHAVEQPELAAPLHRQLLWLASFPLTVAGGIERFMNPSRRPMDLISCVAEQQDWQIDGRIAV